MAYLISGGCNDAMAIIAFKAFKFFVEEAHNRADVDPEDIELATKMLREEFSGFSHCIDPWEGGL